MIEYQPTLDYLKDNSPFVGLVVDNYESDKRRGFCRVRVSVLHDNFDDEDLPWAEPRGNNDGKEFRLPQVGVMVNVFYPTGSIYHPEYSATIHFDPNLQAILDRGSKEDYLSTTAFLVDTNTQFWVDQKDGVTLDYKNTGLNIDKNSNIHVQLSNQSKKMTIGSKDADQPVILGKNFTDWFDQFVNHLSGAFGGPYLGNLGAPVIANPAFIALLQQYKAFKEPRFLSKNVIVIDNFKTKNRSWIDKGKQSAAEIIKEQTKVQVRR